MESILEGYCIFISIYGFWIMGIDKKRAKNHQWRISESRIWIVTLIGGAIGTYIGMRVFRHKTKHKLFWYGLPLIAALWLACYLLLVYLLGFRA